MFHKQDTETLSFVKNHSIYLRFHLFQFDPVRHHLKVVGRFECGWSFFLLHDDSDLEWQNMAAAAHHPQCCLMTLMPGRMLGQMPDH